MKRSITFRTDLSIDKASSILECNKSELIEFLLTTKHDFYEVLMFAHGILAYHENPNDPSAWYYYEGRSFNLKSVPYDYWNDARCYSFSERLNMCLYMVEGYLISLSSEV